METYSPTQQIVALSTTESEYISIKDVAHALETSNGEMDDTHLSSSIDHGALRSSAS